MPITVDQLKKIVSSNSNQTSNNNGITVDYLKSVVTKQTTPQSTPTVTPIQNIKVNTPVEVNKPQQQQFISPLRSNIPTTTDMYGNKTSVYNPIQPSNVTDAKLIPTPKKDENIFQKIAGFIGNIFSGGEEQNRIRTIAEAQNAVGVLKVAGQPLVENRVKEIAKNENITYEEAKKGVENLAVQKNKSVYDVVGLSLNALAQPGGNPFKQSLFEDVSRELGIRADPSNAEFVNGLMTLSIASGVIASPVNTIKALGYFSAVNELESAFISAIKGEVFTFGKGYTLSDAFNSTNKDVTVLIDTIDFLGKASITSGIFKAEPKLITKLTKDVIVKYDLPKTVKFTPEQAKEIIRGRNTGTPEAEVLQKAGLNAKEIKTLIKEGGTITLPSEKLTYMVDKPYWSKIKGMFGKVEEPKLVKSETTGLKIKPGVKEKPLQIESADAKTYKSAEDYIKNKGVKFREDTNTSLVEEAKKYGSAKEFVNSKVKVKVYRGIEAGDNRGINAGDYVTTDIKLAQSYAGSGGKIIEQEIPINQLRGGEISKEFFYTPNDQSVKKVEQYFKNNPTLKQFQLTEIWNKANNKGPKYRTADDLNTASLTTKILKDLEGKTTVSKQYLLDATNRPELRQVEKDIVRSLLEGEGDKIDVAKFSEKLKAELLPLTVKSSDLIDPKKNTYESKYVMNQGNFTPKYENVSLPDDIKGKVANYKENIYESPVKTTAGETHFNYLTKNYFGHTRIEDMADGKTRRVIEVQSDLYQKGNLQKSTKIAGVYFDKEDELAHKKEIAKLQQYNDPTAHLRMIREEVKKAADDGKDILLFPTGETAMKIEGLGDTSQWYKGESYFNREFDNYDIKVKSDELKIGQIVRQGSGIESRAWIITEVLGDGKFKAFPKDFIESLEVPKDKWVSYANNNLVGRIEQFDISGKVDTNNPIYKFYEKEVSKYLRNKYNAQTITDDNGVTWYKVDIKPEYKGPVEAFRIKDDLAKAGFNITDAQEKQIMDFNKRVFGDEDVKITTQILANKNALGKYEKGMIEIVDGKADPKDTYYHEVVHKYLDVMTTQQEQVNILLEASKLYNTEDFVKVEEQLAEDFIKYAKSREGFTGRLKTFIDKVLLKIKSFLKFSNEVDKLYNDIVSGKKGLKETKETQLKKQIELERNIHENLVKIEKDFLDGKITIEQRKNLADKEFARSNAYNQATEKTVPSNKPTTTSITENTLKPGTELKASNKPIGTGKKKVSKAYSRIVDRLTEETKMDVSYNVMNIKDTVRKSMEFVAENPGKAASIAFGLEDAPEGLSTTSINIALADKALRTGQYVLASQLEASRSLSQTRKGQDIVLERGRFNDNSPYFYYRELMDRRLTTLGLGYRENIVDAFNAINKEAGKNVSNTPKGRALRKIDVEKAKLKARVQAERVKSEIKSAQDFIDSIIC